jgi:hypothetical protein
MYDMSGFWMVEMLFVSSLHKLPEFTAAVSVTINFMVLVVPVSDTFSTVTQTQSGLEGRECVAL